ncbi:MAG: hypothetical protein AB1410_09750 [Acidobacteriota bacterium]
MASVLLIFFGMENLEEILKRVLIWRLKYFCRPVVFMTEDEKELEANRVLFIILTNYEIWKFLTDNIGKEIKELEKGFLFNLEQIKRDYEIKIYPIDEAILYALSDMGKIMFEMKKIVKFNA